MSKKFRMFKEFTTQNSKINRDVTLCAFRESDGKEGTVIKFGITVRKPEDEDCCKKEAPVGEMTLNRKIALGKADKNPFIVLKVAVKPEDCGLLTRNYMDFLQSKLDLDIDCYVASLKSIVNRNPEPNSLLSETRRVDESLTVSNSN